MDSTRLLLEKGTGEQYMNFFLKVMACYMKEMQSTNLLKIKDKK